jgi:hypothetical protein
LSDEFSLERNPDAMNELRILSPTGGLGYGFPEESLEEGLKRNPHLIGVDAGSTDPGPYYLGAGKPALSWEAIERDLELLLEARQKLGIPFIIGSAGLSGSQPGLDRTIDIIRDIAKEKGFRFKLARIGSDMDKEYLKRSLKKGKIKTFELTKALTAEDIDRSERIVAQMGMEPFIEALKMGADVIVAGRAYDPAVIAALPIMKGFDPGLAIHMGKILECGGMAAEPSAGADCMFGTIRHDHFLIEPLNRNRKCTVASASAHTLYEKDNPVKMLLPGGMIDLTETTFDPLSDRVVRVAKTKFVKSNQYTLKLEGTKKVGYRSIFIAGARDPIFIREVDHLIEIVRENVERGLPYDPGEDYQLLFHIYGKDGVMGEWESAKDIRSHELGIVGEAVGRTQEIAHAVCTYAHGVMLHYPYEGRKAISGNLAFLYSPSDFDLGEVFEFNIYHLLEVEDPVSLFPITLENV